MMRWVGRTVAGLVLVVFVAVLVGCGGSDGAATDAGSTGSTGAAGAGALEGRWLLSQQAVDGARADLGAGVRADITFSKGRVSGSGPVNTYFGPYTADADGALSFGPLARTEMAGSPAQNAAEDLFFRQLEATRAYTLTDGRLALRDGAGAELLVFTAAEATVVGEWTVTGFNNGDQAVVSPLPGSELTVDFAADGTLSGDGGVNRYRAGYTTAPAAGGELTIHVDEPASTMKAGDPKLMDQEQRFLAALVSARTVTFQGTSITLRTADDAIALTLIPR